MKEPKKKKVWRQPKVMTTTSKLLRDISALPKIYVIIPTAKEGVSKTIEAVGLEEIEKFLQELPYD